LCNGLLHYIKLTCSRPEAGLFPLGLGSRHVAAASITHETDAVAVVVSESSVVRIFDKGKLVAEIIPEIWLFGDKSFKISGPIEENTVADLRIVTIKKSD